MSSLSAFFSSLFPSLSPWTYVVLGGLCEVLWSVGLKYTDGFTRPLPSLGVGIALAASMWLLALGVRDLPIGTAYAVWVGIGVIGAALAGAVLFGEGLSFARVFFLVLLVASIVGLGLSSPARG